LRNAHCFNSKFSEILSNNFFEHFQTGSYSSTNFIKKLFFNVDPEVLAEQQHAQPFFMMLDADQDYAGIYIETGGAALEVEVQPGLFIDGPVEPNENQTVSAQHPLLVFRSMSNFVLLHLFVGPTPKEVTNQLTKYIGKPR
jgi:hypothetical protein